MHQKLKDTVNDNLIETTSYTKTFKKNTKLLYFIHIIICLNKRHKRLCTTTPTITIKIRWLLVHATKWDLVGRNMPNTKQTKIKMFNDFPQKIKNKHLNSDHQWWPPEVAIESLAVSTDFGVGRIITANIALMTAATAPTTNAGKLPPPNKASHGPLNDDTIIWKCVQIPNKLNK